jgi:hypothetical protein
MLETLAEPDELVGGVGDLGLAEFEALVGVLASEYIDPLLGWLLVWIEVGYPITGVGACGGGWGDCSSCCIIMNSQLLFCKWNWERMGSKDDFLQQKKNWERKTGTRINKMGEENKKIG